jgi:hypothetical protein
MPIVRFRSQKRHRRGGWRAEPISDWLGFIRPHFESYRTLPWGQQREFIEKLSKTAGSSTNTLRRFIAGAELLEGFGITAIPPDLTRLPIASVEAVGRISKRDPARGRFLLDQLLRGAGTIRDLKDELADMPKGRPVAPRRAPSPLSRKEFHKELEELEGLVRKAVAAESLPPERKIMPFVDWPGPKQLFTKAAWPVLLYPLLLDRYVAIFEDTVLTWGISPALATREFLRNIAVSVTVFEAVVIYCNVLQADVARVVDAMRGDLRGRILLQKGSLRLTQQNVARQDQGVS